MPEKNIIMSFHWSKHDDGSLSISFINREQRFEIILEKDLSESSWHYVNKDYDNAGAELPAELLDAIKSHLTTHAPDLANELHCQHGYAFDCPEGCKDVCVDPPSG